MVKCSQPGGDLQEEGCYLPSFGCNGGSIGPHVCVPRGDGSRERVVTERGEERGGRAPLKHLGSQTAALEEGGTAGGQRWSPARMGLSTAGGATTGGRASRCPRVTMDGVRMGQPPLCFMSPWMR